MTTTVMVVFDYHLGKSENWLQASEVDNPYSLDMSWEKNGNVVQQESWRRRETGKVTGRKSSVRSGPT